MKKLIRQVLDELGDTQINLGSEASRETISTLISAALKEKGEYKKHTNDELEKQKVRETWVCSICSKNTYDIDWDYIGSGTNHLSCEVRLELDEKKLKEREKKLYEDQGDGHLLEIKDTRIGEDRRKEQLSDIQVDRREEDRRKKNWTQKKHEDKVFNNQNWIDKLSEEIVSDTDTGYIYESPDGGKTVYKRKMGSDKRELVKDWKEKNQGGKVE